MQKVAEFYESSSLLIKDLVKVNYIFEAEVYVQSVKHLLHHRHADFIIVGLLYELVFPLYLVNCFLRIVAGLRKKP